MTSQLVTSQLVNSSLWFSTQQWRFQPCDSCRTWKLAGRIHKSSNIGQLFAEDEKFSFKAQNLAEPNLGVKLIFHRYCDYGSRLHSAVHKRGDVALLPCRLCQKVFWNSCNIIVASLLDRYTMKVYIFGSASATLAGTSIFATAASANASSSMLILQKNLLHAAQQVFIRSAPNWLRDAHKNASHALEQLRKSNCGEERRVDTHKKKKSS